MQNTAVESENDGLPENVSIKHSTFESSLETVKEIKQLRVDLKIKEKQLSQIQTSINVYEDEMEALEKECQRKVDNLEQEVSKLSKYFVLKIFYLQNFIRFLIFLVCYNVDQSNTC